MCVCCKKTNFRIGFLCKSLGKQTEMCIKLQQCNKLRDAKVQQGINLDGDGVGVGEMTNTVKYRGFSALWTISLSPNPPGQVQWYAKNCMSLRCQPDDILPGVGTPRDGCSRVFYVVRFFGKLTVWPQCGCVCLCVLLLLLQLQLKRKIINILVAKATLPSRPAPGYIFL